MEKKLVIKRGPGGLWVMVNESGEYMCWNLKGFTPDLEDAYQFEDIHVEACYEWAQLFGYDVTIERESVSS